jgi:hypothetical protein
MTRTQGMSMREQRESLRAWETWQETCRGEQRVWEILDDGHGRDRHAQRDISALTRQSVAEGASTPWTQAVSLEIGSLWLSALWKLRTTSAAVIGSKNTCISCGLFWTKC